jgi:hypothetical protein
MRIRRIRRRRGSTLQWWIMSIGIVITACGVFLWVRNLPDPPRFSPLTLEPGAAVVRSPKATVEITVEGRTFIRPVSTIEFDLAEGESIAADVPAGAFKAVYQVAIDLPDVTFASLGADFRDCRVRFVLDGEEIRSSTGEILTKYSGIETDLEIESGSMVFPAGRSEFEIEVEASNATPAFRAWWRLDSDGLKSALPILADPSESSGA